MFFSGEVLENRQLSEKIFHMRIATPHVDRYVPGQFLMLKAWKGSDPLLPRPFAIYAWKEEKEGSVLHIIYKVVGKGTMILSGIRKGEPVQLNGPLGNGFTLPGGKKYILFAGGGVGFSSILPVAKAMKEKGLSLKVLLGAREEKELPPLDQIDEEGMSHDDILFATEDGSSGYHGLVTDLLAEESETLSEKTGALIYACGPEAMLARVKEISIGSGIPAYLSMENFMACGFGVCLGCVIKTERDGREINKRVCIEGPVFPADEVIFHG